MSYMMTAAVISHAVPSVWSWGWWGLSTAWNATYWLCYGRYAEARKEARKQEELVQRIKKELQMELQLELAPGGTDVILVRKNK